MAEKGMMSRRLLALVYDPGDAAALAITTQGLQAHGIAYRVARSGQPRDEAEVLNAALNDGHDGHGRPEWLLQLYAGEALGPTPTALLEEHLERQVAWRLAVHAPSNAAGLYGWRPRTAPSPLRQGPHPQAETPCDGWLARPEIRLFPAVPGASFEHFHRATAAYGLRAAGLPEKPGRLEIFQLRAIAGSPDVGRINRERERLLADPTLADRLPWLCQALKDTDQIAKAEGVLVVHRRLRPEDPEATRLLADHYSQQRGRERLAATEWQRYLTSAPFDAQALTQLARLLLDTQHFGAAAARAQRALDLDPDQPDAFLTLAQVQISRRRFDQALRDAETALRMAPRYVRGPMVRGRAHEERENVKLAMQDYRRAIDLAEGSAEPWLRLGSLALRAGHQALGRKALEKCVELDPTCREAAKLLSSSSPAKLAEAG